MSQTQPDGETDVWVVVTRDPGVYIVGRYVSYGLKASTDVLRLARPALMTRNGTQVKFDRLDTIEKELIVPVANHPGYGRLSKTYKTHYEKFLRLEDPIEAT